VLVLLALAPTGCGSGNAPTAARLAPRVSEQKLHAGAVRVDVDTRRPPLMLSEFNLFKDLKNKIPNDGVIPYRLNTSHFTDYATSRHYLYLPRGTRASYHPTDVFSFPVGTVLVQTLGFLSDLRDPRAGERIVETRLLIHQKRGWLAVPYLWNEDGSDARRAVVGGKSLVRWIHFDGSQREHQFVTPDMNQCRRCHTNRDAVGPIGVRARNLKLQLDGHGGNQLARWVEAGMLEQAPDSWADVPAASVWNDPSTGSVQDRARTWLDVNCACCHNPEGAASVTGLDLSILQNMPVRFGVYKPPVAAGRGSAGYQFSITPGRPGTSFLLHRIRSTDPGVMMPTVGRGLVDEEGAALVEEWIGQMRVDEQLARRALNPVEAYREALAGGDASRGRELFYFSSAKCSSCHRADRPDGGEVGPSLADVGSRTQREYLLESIVSPSAKIVEKYAAAIIEHEEGQIYTGIIASEDANELVLKAADATQIKLLKSGIANRAVSPVSIMPSMANILSVQDVADLVEFLSSQKAVP
jgi:uncharacterized repeat protein (TIGR03806 family)